MSIRRQTHTITVRLKPEDREILGRVAEHYRTSLGGALRISLANEHRRLDKNGRH